MVDYSLESCGRQHAGAVAVPRRCCSASSRRWPLLLAGVGIYGVTSYGVSAAHARDRHPPGAGRLGRARAARHRRPRRAADARSPWRSALTAAVVHGASGPRRSCSASSRAIRARLPAPPRCSGSSRWRRATCPRAGPRASIPSSRSRRNGSARFSGSGFRVLGSRFRVLGFRVPGFGVLGSGSGFGTACALTLAVAGVDRFEDLDAWQLADELRREGTCLYRNRPCLAGLQVSGSESVTHLLQRPGIPLKGSAASAFRVCAVSGIRACISSAKSRMPFSMAANESISPTNSLSECGGQRSAVWRQTPV